jgi:hypothetical protein
MPARSGAPGQRARKRLFIGVIGVTGVEEGAEMPSWRGLGPGGEIERQKIFFRKLSLRLQGRGLRPIRCGKFRSSIPEVFVLSR